MSKRAKTILILTWLLVAVALIATREPSEPVHDIGPYMEPLAMEQRAMGLDPDNIP